MSSEIVVAPVVFPALLPAALLALGVGAVYLTAKAVEASAEIAKEAAEKARRERMAREKREAEGKKRIMAQIDYHLRQTALIAEQRETNAPSDDGETSRFREEVMRALAENRQQFEKAQFSEELFQPAADEGRKRKTAHTKEELADLLERLCVVDRAEGAKLSSMVNDIESDLPGRIDAVAIQLKIALSRASEAFAKDIWRRNELSEMRRQTAGHGEYAAWADELDTVINDVR
jgi:hypothetical protein